MYMYIYFLKNVQDLKMSTQHYSEQVISKQKEGIKEYREKGLKKRNQKIRNLI